ncbi:hypothetical protein D1007_35097 [Hordeum vulgare]|nr:hypothetical protein D1007_35097 [Hordeum vulgare]
MEGIRMMMSLFIIPSEGQINYQSILRQQGVSFTDGIIPSDNVFGSPFLAWNDNVSEDSSKSSEESGQSILLLPSISLSISLTSSARSHVGSSFTINNAIVPDLLCLARSVIMTLQNPNILRCSVMLQTSPMHLHLITWNPRSKDDTNFLIPIAPARKMARKLWFEDTLASSNIQFLVENVEPFGHVQSSVVISKLSDDDREAQVEDSFVGNVLAPSPSLVRRSPRSNKYMDFKVDLPSDSRGPNTMIKPRVSSVIVDPPPNPTSNVSSSNSATPPPTSIRCIQQVGAGFYGIPLEELAEDRMLSKGNSASETNDGGQ